MSPLPPRYPCLLRHPFFIFRILLPCTNIPDVGTVVANTSATISSPPRPRAATASSRLEALLLDDDRSRVSSRVLPRSSPSPIRTSSAPTLFRRAFASSSSLQLKYSQEISEHFHITSPGFSSKKMLSGYCHKDNSSGISWLTTKSFPVSKVGRKFYSSRCITLLENSQRMHTINDLLPYMKSTFSELEGPNHCWFNRNAAYVPSFEEKGIFLVLMGAFLHKPASISRRKQILLLEGIKMLQKLNPNLLVFGFQQFKLASSLHDKSLVAMTVAEEYTQFPILLSCMDFCKGIELPNEGCYLLFRGSKNEVLQYNADVDVRLISAEIDKYNLLPSFKSHDAKEKHINEVGDLEVSRGFHSCSSFKNMLLNYPGCVSADEDGDCLFISDTNNHRIIVSNGQGKIIDFIGSLPGKADGGFESAHLLRPAGSIYRADEDCLYFADCENHSIRKAHLTSRVVDTLYPVYSHKQKGIWHWIMNKFSATRGNDKSLEEFTLDSFAFPWHLMRFGDDGLLVLTRSLETSWILSMETGQIKNVLKGFSNIMDTYKDVITEKASLIKEVCRSHLPSMINPDSSLELFPYLYLISSATKFKEDIIFCDAAAQRVLKCDSASSNIECINFSDVGILGVSQWVNPVETCVTRGTQQTYRMDHIQHFDVFPGSCNIIVSVDLPYGFELEGPLREECIWWEARGSASLITGTEDAESSKKVGVAQRWYDEMDNIAYSKLDPQSIQLGEENSDSMSPDEKEKKIFIKCAANTSPGTSEIVLVAALYLKLQAEETSASELKSKLHDLCKEAATGDSIDLMLESVKDSRGLIFVKPLHLRIKLDCADHPTDPLSREIIPTNTSMRFNVNLGQ